MKTTRKRKAIFLMLINTFLWGIAAPIIKVYMRSIPVYIFLAYRFIWATLFLLVIMLALNKRFNLGFWIKHKFLLLMAFLQNAVVLILLFAGLDMVNSGFAAVLAGTTPIMADIIGALYFKEKIEKNEISGTILAIIAFLGLAGVSLHTNSQNSILGGSLIFLANIVFLATSFAVKWAKLEDKHGKVKLPQDFVWQFNFFGFLSSGLVLILIGGFLKPQYFSLPSLVFLLFNPGVIYLALFASIIALIAYVKAVEIMEVSEALYYTYLQPLFALPLAAVWLHEPLNWFLFTFFALIDLVAFIINIKNK